MGFLSSIYNSAHNNIPLSQRDIVDLSPGLLGIGAEGSRAVNFQSILNTGQAAVFRPNDSIRGQTQYIDWNSDDSFTRALSSIEQRSVQRIQSDPELQQLLLKEQWDKSDRTAWEKRTSQIVSEEHSNTPGLSEYRNIVFDKFKDETKTRALRLNDLSDDIDNNTNRIEHDCESMSIVEGSILQKIENQFFANSANDENFKGSTNYFYTTGVKGEYSSWKNGYGHAFIISSATGNIIESTTTLGSVYNQNIDPNYTFESFARGKATYTEYGEVYAPNDVEIREIVDNKIQIGSIKNVDSLYDDVGYLVKGRIADTFDTLSSVPPEVAGLIDIRERIMDLEKEIANPSWTSNPERMMAQVDGYKAMFNREVESLKDTGGIEAVAEFMNSGGGREIITVGQKSDQVMHALREMYANAGPDELQSKIDETFMTGLPKIDGKSFDSYDSFIDARMKKDFSALNNMVSYEDSYGAYKTDPTSELGQQYEMARQFIMMQYPEPGTEMSRSFVSVKMESVLADYQNFVQSRADNADTPSIERQGPSVMGQPSM